MVKLLYKTREDSTPVGKPRVYFCCHKTDFKLYFDILSKDILSLNDCSIWYLENYDAERDEAFFENIKRMQLFVMPVTLEFLTADNLAFNVDVKFALDNNIPVLPIVLESGLVSEFNKRFGEIQFLYRGEEDNSAIKYEVKLEKYLNETIGNDEMIARIKAAFDAYVFLSYRKMDRVYADSLMRLIHKDDLCRDIAIWYDEFLVPGENFNDSIKRMIEDSKMFLLTVTPNVVGTTTDENGVEQDNYIIRMEYPTAKEKGIPVLPVEIVSTDKEKLSEKYIDLGDCADGKDEKAVSENVIETIKKIALGESDEKNGKDCPKHIFFIGLAYLYGIDVEIDHQKGIKLIETAAGEGLFEATVKLAEIYKRGIAVEYNYEKAVYWFERSVEITENQYVSEKNEENLLLLITSLMGCGDFYSESGDHITAANKYRKAVEYYNSCVNAANELKCAVAECYGKLGDASVKSFCPDEAIMSYGECLKILDELKNDGLSPELRKSYFVCYCRFGDVYLSEGNMIEAEKNYSIALEMVENVQDEANNPFGGREKALIYGKMCELSCRKMDINNAESFCGKKYDIIGEIFEETKSISDKREYAYVKEKFADIWMDEDITIFDAGHFYSEAEAVFEDIYEKTATLGSKLDLARLYNKFGNFFVIYNQETKRNTNADEDEEYYNKSNKLCMELTRETELLSVQKELSISFAGLARVCFNKGKYEESRLLCEKALETFSKFRDEDSVTMKLEYADGCSKIAGVFADINYVEMAEELCLREIEVYRSLMTKNSTYDISFKCADGMYKVACLYKKIRSWKKVPDFLERAIEIIEPLLKKTSDQRVPTCAASIYIAQADYYYENGNEELAHKKYHLALKILKKQLRIKDNGPNNARIAFVWYKLSFVSGKDRKKCLVRSLEIYEELASKYKNYEKYKEAAIFVRAELDKTDC